MSNRYSSLFLLPLLLGGLLAVGSADSAHAQDDDDRLPRFDLSGFLKVDAFYDTRQTVAAREGEFLLYPGPVNEQPRSQDDGFVDVNDRNNLNMTSFYTRLRLGISAPEVLGAETVGVIESDFLGTTNGLENTVRLRHAFVKMDWDTHELLLGQYWSPFFLPQMFPPTISFNLGAPIHPLARFPQARLTVRPTEHVSLIGLLSVQRDAYQDIAGRETQQQAAVPGAQLHAQFSNDLLFAGAGAYLRTVRPHLTSERLTSGSVTAYAALEADQFTLRSQLLYGSNMADHLMLGGYAQTGAGNDVAYHNLRTLAAWADLSTGWDSGFNAGLYGGYTASLGASDDVSTSATFQARGPNLAYVWRVSPRVSYDFKSVRFALELESTTALYASDYAADLKPEADGDDDPVTNTRLLFSTFLFF